MARSRQGDAIDGLVITALQLELDPVLTPGEGGERGCQEAWDRSRFRYNLREIPRDRRAAARPSTSRQHGPGRWGRR